MARVPRSTAPTVNLFPFLAVLLCMMGALVFLLIALSGRVGIDPATIVREPAGPVFVEPLPVRAPDPIVIRPPLSMPEPVIHESPIVHARQSQEDVDGPIEDEISRLKQALAAAQALREEQLASQDAAAREVARLQDSLRNMTAEREQYAAYRRVAEQRLADSQTAVDEAVDALALLNDELTKKAAAPRARATKFRLLPYDRTTGTQRYPIVVECLADGYRFAVEDVDVSGRDFAGRTFDSNPLLDGVDALASYYARRGERPYVLLVVRPDGIASLRIARGILQKARRRWGYELVPTEMELDWPKGDAAAYDALVAGLSRRAGTRGEPLAVSGDVFAYASELAGKDRAEAAQRAIARRDAHIPGQRRGASGREMPSSEAPAAGQSGGIEGDPYLAGLPGELPSVARSRDVFGNVSAPPTRAGASSVAGGQPTSFGLPQASPSPAVGNTSESSGRATPRTMSFEKPKKWGKQSPDQFIGYERQVEIEVVDDRIVWNDQSIEGITRLPAQELEAALSRLLDVVAADWEPPRRGMYWRPTLVASGRSTVVDARIEDACENLDVSFRRDRRRKPSVATPSATPTRFDDSRSEKATPIRRFFGGNR